MNTDIYKTKLEEEKKLLLEELSDIGKVDKTGDWEATPENEMNSQEVQDEADMAERAEDYEERTGTLSTLEIRLKNVTKALNLIKEGKYGICQVCGEEIEKERLDANASSLTCKEHKDIIV